MNHKNNSLEHSLQNIAHNPQAQDLFGFERIRRAGSMLWEERFSVRLGQEQCLSRNRHFVDEGNVPIGLWEAPVDQNRIQQIAQALLDIKMWELKPEPFQPDEEHVLWQVITLDGSHRVSNTRNFELKKTMHPVDSLLRSMIKELMNNHLGAELLCKLTLQKAMSGFVGKIALLNQGNKDCLVPNPFLLGRGKTDYLRLEMGAMPENPELLTDAGIRYEPLPLPTFDSLPAHWDSQYLHLGSGKSLEFPFEIAIPWPSKKGFYVRAVFSCYSAPMSFAGFPVIRGRAFSEETELVV